jgi:hypothetical protein
MPSPPSVNISVEDGYLSLGISGASAGQHYKIQKSYPLFEGGRLHTISDNLQPTGLGSLFFDGNIPSGMVIAYRVATVDAAGVEAYANIITGSVSLPNFYIQTVARPAATTQQQNFGTFPIGLDGLSFVDVRGREMAVAATGSLKPNVTPGFIHDRFTTIGLRLHGASRESNYQALRSIAAERRIVCVRSPLGAMVFGCITELRANSDLVIDVPFQISAYPYKEEIVALS